MSSVNIGDANEELRHITLCNDVVTAQPTETIDSRKRAPERRLCSARELLNGLLRYLFELVPGHASVCGHNSYVWPEVVPERLDSFGANFFTRKTC